MAQSDGKAYLALTLAMILAGSSVVSGKYTVGSFPIYVASVLRVGLAFGILIILVLLLEHRIRRLSWRTHVTLFLQALTGIVIFNAFMLAGLERTTASTSGIITSATPVMVLVLSLFFGERLNRRSLVGVAIATIGLVVLTIGGGNDGSAGSSELLGGFLVFIAVIGEAFFTIFGKMVAERLTPLAQAMWISLYGFLMFVPLAIYDLPNFDVGDTRASGWIAIGYSGLMVTVFSAYLWFVGLRSVPASRAGIFIGMIPVSAVVLSALLLKESIGWLHVIGIACVLIAIALISYRSRRPDPLVTVPTTG